MKKLSTLMFFLLFVLVICEAQTNVSGLINSNTTWTTTGSPYIVTGNVLVNTGITLTIEPGVSVKFNSGKALQIRGVLRAIGTTADKILFTSNLATPAPADWVNILFYEQSQGYDTVSGTGCIMKHCIVEYAGVQDSIISYGAIRSFINTPYIGNCIIRNNKANGIQCNQVTQSLKIDSCVVESNYGYGIVAGSLQDSAHTSITIENCTVNNNAGSGISIWYGKKIIVKNNDVIENGGGISIDANDTVFLYNNLIENNYGSCSITGKFVGASRNIIHNNHSGFTLGSTFGYFTNNISVCNHFSPSIYYGALRFYGVFDSTFDISKNIIAYNSGGGIVLSTGEVNFTKNTIFSNSVGFYSFTNYHARCHNNTICNQKALPSYNPSTLYIDNAYSPYFQNNNIFNNPGYGFVNYLLQSEPDFILQNNWWGTSNDSIIQTDYIYDWFDNSTLGIVIYQPFLLQADTIAPVSPPQNFTKSDLGGGTVLLTWDPNPESDIAGYKVYWGSPTGYSFTNFIDVGNSTSYILSGVSFSDTIAVTAYDNMITGIDDQFNGNESWFSYNEIYPCVGVADNYFQSEKIAITAYPNPAEDIIHVVMSEASENTVIEIFDITGQKVLSQNDSGSSDIIVPVTHLNKGLYLISAMVNNERSALIKMIKK